MSCRKMTDSPALIRPWRSAEVSSGAKRSGARSRCGRIGARKQDVAARKAELQALVQMAAGRVDAIPSGNPPVLRHLSPAGVAGDSSLISILRNRTSPRHFRKPRRPEKRLKPGAG